MARFVVGWPVKMHVPGVSLKARLVRHRHAADRDFVPGQNLGRLAALRRMAHGKAAVNLGLVGILGREKCLEFGELA